jgi:hypothetical protein
LREISCTAEQRETGEVADFKKLNGNSALAEFRTLKAVFRINPGSSGGEFSRR